MIRALLRDRLATVAATLGCVIGGLAYVLILLDFRTDWTRRAVELGFGSNFFDLQARAFLAGRLWLPEGALGIEAFTQRGHDYMYFPPFPALVRVPIFLVTDRYDGRLTLLMMVLAFVIYAVMAAKLTWLIRSCLIRTPLTVPEAVAGGLFLAVVTGGTVLTFDAALPWVYHEVYVWAVALVVAALYWLLRATLEPSLRNLVWLGLSTTAAILTRTTGGFAVALIVIVVGGWFASSRRGELLGRRGLLMIAAGLVPIALSIAYNWAKFRHPYLFPLEDQVWTQVNAHRREALLVNGGTITGPQFLGTTLVNYFSPTGIRLTPWFPWITLPAEPAQAVGGAFVDQTYRTGSVIPFNPLLFGLSIWALVILVLRRQEKRVRALGGVLIAAVGVGGGVMMYGYLTMRYTSEFVPALVVGGAIGLWALVPALTRKRRPMVAGAVVMALLVIWSIVAHMATGHTASVMTGRGPALKQYVTTQLELASGDPRRMPPITDVPSQPVGGSTDALGIEGECDALYVNTGDQYDPWILVERRAVAIAIQAGPVVRPGRVPLFDIESGDTRRVVLEIDKDQNALIFIEGPDGDALGAYLPVHSGQTIRVGVGIDAARGMAVVSATPGGRVARVPWAHWSEDWITVQGHVERSAGSDQRAAALGLTITDSATPPLSLCNRVAASRAW